jgi:hypothetical protein
MCSAEFVHRTVHWPCGTPDLLSTLPRSDLCGERRTPQPHACDERCAPRTCKPLALSSVRRCHAVLSGAVNTVKRWDWITANPLDAAQRPRIPALHLHPPSLVEEAKIVADAHHRGKTR